MEFLLQGQELCDWIGQAALAVETIEAAEVGLDEPVPFRVRCRRSAPLLQVRPMIPLLAVCVISPPVAVKPADVLVVVARPEDAER